MYPKEHLGGAPRDTDHFEVEGTLVEGWVEYDYPRMDIELVPSKLYTMAKPLSKRGERPAGGP